MWRKSLTPPESLIQKIAPAICSQLHERSLEKTCTALDQGWIIKTCSKHPASNHWIKNGNYTSFSAYRFAIKARLNLQNNTEKSGNKHRRHPVPKMPQATRDPGSHPQPLSPICRYDENQAQQHCQTTNKSSSKRCWRRLHRASNT